MFQYIFYSIVNIPHGDHVCRIWSSDWNWPRTIHSSF